MKRIDSTRSLANFIREIRKMQGLSQRDIAQTVGLRQATISKIENESDGVKLETVFRVLSSLGYNMYLKSKNDSGQKSSKKWTEEW